MRKSNESRRWIIMGVILLSSHLAVGDSTPNLSHIRVPDHYSIYPEQYFCVNYGGQKFWSIRVMNRAIKASNDDILAAYDEYRKYNWVILNSDDQLVCDGSIYKDLALVAEGAFRIWVYQDSPVPQTGWIPVRYWSPEALKAKAAEWEYIVNLSIWQDIFQAVGNICGGTVTTLLLGPASELQKLTVREALKVTAKTLLDKAIKYHKEEKMNPMNGYKQALRDRAINAVGNLRVHANKNIRVEFGDCIDFSEIIAFSEGVRDIQARGEGATRGLYKFYEGGLAQYLIGVIENADPSELLKEIDDIIAGDQEVAAAMDAVEYWDALAVMRRKGTLDGATSVMDAFCNANQEPKLLAYWNFDEGNGSIASDSSGNGNDGTIHGSAWTAGRIGYALGFDGINDWVDIPDDISPGHITLEAWIYPIGVYDIGDHGSPILTKETGRGTQPWAESFAWRLRITPFTHRLQLQCFTPTGIGGGSSISDTILEMGNWYHVAGTYDGTHTKVYINGNLEGSSTASISEPLVTSTLPAGIGYLPNWSVQWFKGIIDEARIYDKALSDSEIKKSADVEPSAPALEPVNDLVSVLVGRIGYDRRTGQFSVDVTVTNTSNTLIGNPIWLVIENISDASITLAYSDGTTTDGYEYIDLSDLLGDGRFEPDESLTTRIYFKNPNRRRFTFETSVRGIILP